MTVQIINYGAFIRISIDSSILLVAKSQIKIVEVIRDDTIRINIGEGPLKEILVRLYDVTFPAGLIDIAALRDYVSHLLDTGSKFEDDALIHMQSQINELIAIKQQFNVVNGSMQVDLGYQQAQLSALVAIDSILTRTKDLYQQFLDNQEKELDELKTHTTSLLSIDKGLISIKSTAELSYTKLEQQGTELKQHTQLLTDSFGRLTDIKTVLEHSSINQDVQLSEIGAQTQLLSNILNVVGKTEGYNKTMLANQNDQSSHFITMKSLLTDIRDILKNKP
jgi:hypothetical protein